MNCIAGWTAGTLGEYFRIKHGYAFKGEFFTDNGQYILLTPGSFQAQGGLQERGEREKYYRGNFPPEFLLRPGEMLVVMTDLTQNAPILGSPAIIPTAERFLHNQRLGKIVGLDESRMSKPFLYHLFNLPDVRAQIRGSATGSTVRHTAPDRIYAVDVRVPPLPVQERIAYTLSAYDDLIENNTRRIKILEEMAQMLYREWFVNFRFPGHEKVKMVKSQLGPIPDEWKTGILRDVCASLDYGFTASAMQDAVGPKFLRITDIVPTTIDWQRVPFCSMSDKDSEDAAVEQPTIALFKELGWETLNCYHETFGPLSPLGRETMAEVVLPNRLRIAIEHLNPGLSPNAMEMAILEVTKDRSALSSARANQAVYQLLKNGVKVTYRGTGDDDQEETVEIVTLIDWNEPEKNDYLLASQFWISGDYGRKRADLVGFVNGIPLVFIELKASHKKLELAYEMNLSDYKDTIPQAFWYNGVVILSNGSKARIGSMTAGFEHFAEWKKIDDEKESGLISLDTMIRGVCEKRKLLDLVENFTLFDDRKGDLTKLVAKNHQLLGVNNAIAAVGHIRDNHGKLGVFWHTQGSGKSYSMVFFSQKVLRKIPGNWTFVIVTDRDDLDGQIYRNFANTGAVLEDEKRVRADSGDSLKRMLNQEDHRYVFTLIQKFHTEHGERYPVLSTRSDIIVITDEAHRSQYDIFASNMRSALPNAAFIGFTGTPLMAGEERTKEVFGEYVSIYNFKESVDDQNTVPLYYENRIPELQLTNDKLTEDIAEICDRADLDDDQERKLEKEFAREYHLITRDDRLDRIGEDIVAHYMGRGVLAKAMVISIDKATAVRTFDKVQQHWKTAIAKLRTELAAADPMDKPDLEKRLKFFEETDMAVVVSSAQNEIEEFKQKGLDIAKHRKRMVKEDLETKFKNSDDPLRIVFVCAMWITGFDVPSCSTIYLDKPMKNHTLMQTIARANRVWRDKQNGLIVDYVGVFRNLQKALAIYGTAQGEAEAELSPVHKKEELVSQLREAISGTTAFCMERTVNPATIQEARGFEREKLKEDAVAALVVNDDTRRGYLSRAGYVDSLFKSLLPDIAANEFGPVCKVFRVVADKIRSEIPAVDITEVMAEIEALLDQSIGAEGYVMPPVADEGRYVDLSQIDFESLRDKFEGSRKTIEVQKLRAKLTFKLARMIQVNSTRIDFLEEFQKMIDEYNNGAINVQVFFDKLLVFARRLDAEQKRGLAEHLTEEELVIFDLLTKPDVVLTKEEVGEVKKVARSLLEKLKKEQLVLDWRKQQTTRAMVFRTIREVLDELPRAYDKPLYEKKCDTVYQHFYEAYVGQGKSVYGAN